jgi:hypothetical protein
MSIAKELREIAARSLEGQRPLPVCLFAEVFVAIPGGCSV